MKITVRNLTRSTVLATAAGVAGTSLERKVGLLRHESLPRGEGLFITPCEGVHTAGMKFPIDVLFLSKKRKVVKISAALKPWRISLCLRAHSVLELPAGMAAETATEPGDQLEFETREEVAGA